MFALFRYLESLIVMHGVGIVLLYGVLSVLKRKLREAEISLDAFSLKSFSFNIFFSLFSLSSIKRCFSDRTYSSCSRLVFLNAMIIHNAVHVTANILDILVSPHSRERSHILSLNNGAFPIIVEDYFSHLTSYQDCRLIFC